MDFDLTDEQKEIKNVARELLDRALAAEPGARGCRGGRLRPRLWDEIVALGWPGIAVAERYGGQELGAVELAVLARGAWLCVRGDAVLLDRRRRPR